MDYHNNTTKNKNKTNTNTNTSSSSSWDLHMMSMANHLLPHHIPIEFLNPDSLDQFHHHHHHPNIQFTSTIQREAIQEHQADEVDEEEGQQLGAIKDMMYKIAAMQPVDIDPLTIKKPKRRNVRISVDPQSIAARHRRERISERIRILQRLVPGGTKMDTASMLDEAIRYVKFLKRQVQELQANPQPLPQQVGGDWTAAMETGGHSLGLGFGFSTGDCSSGRMG